MRNTIQEQLAVLIGQLDTDGQRWLRRVLVKQVMHYVEMLLGENRNPAERACLQVVAHWLDQPNAPERQQAIEAEIQRGQLLIQDREDWELSGEMVHDCAWDAARATQVPLLEAAHLAVGAARTAAAWRYPPGGSKNRQRGRRVAVARAGTAAAKWQRAAAQAILAGAEPPSLSALPPPSQNQAAIFAALQHEINPHDAYKRQALWELLLLLSPQQERMLIAAERARALHCAEALLPPLAEDRGERACLGSGRPDPALRAQLPSASLFHRVVAACDTLDEQYGLLMNTFAELVCVRVRRHHAGMARAIAHGLPLPAMDEALPLTGWLADYHTGSLDRLCVRLDADELLRLKQALVDQALWYARKALPDAGDRDDRASLEVVEQWLRQPQTALPADRTGPAPAGMRPADKLAWKVVQGLINAARAPDASALVKALNIVITSATSIMTRTSGYSKEAVVAGFHAEDYQLAAAFQIATGSAPPTWLGPDSIYSPDSFGAILRQLSEAQHGLLRWGLIHDGCRYVARGLAAHVVSVGWLPAGRQLVAAIERWAAHPETAIQGERLVPDGTLQAARLATHRECEPMTDALARALEVASEPKQLPGVIPFATHAVATYCERAARRAAHALVERWRLDATYALLNDTDLPLLVP